MINTLQVRLKRLEERATLLGAAPPVLIVGMEEYNIMKQKTVEKQPKIFIIDDV